MFDFLMVSARPGKGCIEVYPKFIARKSKDLMIRGGNFYAIWNEDTGLWSTDQDVAIALIDRELDRYAKEHKDDFDDRIKVLHLWDTDTCMIDKWIKFVTKQQVDNFVPLDEKIIFSNAEPNKMDYASKKLSYSLQKGDISAYDELMSTIYNPEERGKIEWAIGSIISGDSKKNQKFMVLYGPPSSGKSTVINIIEELFDGYFSVFDAKALGNANNAFALEAFKSNPLVAIQHDGDLSKIEDNTKLNSIVSHELMTINEKFKSTYASKFNAFLFMATNKPVRITDAKSGIIRRLIDVEPSNRLVPRARYFELKEQIKFELGAIAYHCLDYYKNHIHDYDDYKPMSMMGATNDFYNFIMENYEVFKEENSTTLKSSWAMYKEYCEYAKVAYPYSYRLFKEELKNYFEKFEERHIYDDGTSCRNFYSNFICGRSTDIDMADRNNSELRGLCNECIQAFELWGYKFSRSTEKTVGIGLMSANFSGTILGESSDELQLPKTYLAQRATVSGTPEKPWSEVKTILSEIDQTQLHYVKLPINHIVIDFDLKDEKGDKSLYLNLKAASNWPKTYAEVSKSGQGLHLHYIYNGDPEKLLNVYDDGIEIKVFKGNSSLRRKLTYFVDLPIATISSGLPLKGEKPMIENNVIQSERSLRTQIIRNLNKEIHPGTKPSIDFIDKILSDAYSSGLHYDVSDLKSTILKFAMNSTNHAQYCIKKVAQMKFKSDEPSIGIEKTEKPIVFFDVEVFPNLFLVCWKIRGKDKKVVSMINPSAQDIEKLLDYRLVGFYNRKYDNHILYGRVMGYSNDDIYNLSHNITQNHRGFFSEAYNLSYADIYDFSSKKQSLKKFEIDLDIHHLELDLPWNKPVDESLWPKVAEYCQNDVIATEAVFDDRIDDFNARVILSELSGLTVNDTARSHVTKIIFGEDKHPELVYTDLSKEFPGYKFEHGRSTYTRLNAKGEMETFEVNEGGRVEAIPGIYGNVGLLDISSMHPTTIEILNLFGKYTKRFSEIKKARILVKHGEIEEASKLLDGKLKPYLTDKEHMKKLAFALKMVINPVYGYTMMVGSEDYNPFRDPRNKDNIVAKRGALFMIDLSIEVQKRGYNVVHIKTDSIKISDVDDDIIRFVMDFGKKYGYDFEHEATYEKMCLVNDAVYIAKYADGEHKGEWTATGAQFQHPYVFKTLFSHEDLIFRDFCEAKSVTTEMYLDMNENLKEDEHAYKFIGRSGLFCPIKPGCGGGILYRYKDGKYYAVGGTKGYRWMESEVVRTLGIGDNIDMSYFDTLANEARVAIETYGDFEWFTSDIPYDSSLPWKGGNIPERR